MKFRYFSLIAFLYAFLVPVNMLAQDSDEKRISDINDNINTEVQITVDKNKARLDAELAANKLVMEKLAAAQAELLERAIEDWRKEELEKVIANPSAYVQSVGDQNI